MGTKVKPGYKLVPCTGEAHRPDVGGMIDNCGVCAPRWGQMEVRNPRYRTRHDFVAEILAVCRRISRAIGSDLRDYDRFQGQITAEERGHRKMAPDGVRHGIQTGTAMLLFTAQQILRNRCAGGYRPQLTDIFHVKLSVYMGAALYAQHAAALDAEFSEDECRAICAEDYAELMQGNFDRPAEAVTPDADA